MKRLAYLPRIHLMHWLPVAVLALASTAAAAAVEDADSADTSADRPAPTNATIAELARQGLPKRQGPALRANLALQDDVSRGLGRTSGTPERGAAVPQAWASQGLNSNRMVLSMQADLSQRTSLVYERAGMARAAEPILPGLPTPPSTKVGFEFRPTTVKSQFPLGAVRMQMSGNSTLLLKPRSGGMTVSWRQQF